MPAEPPAIDAILKQIAVQSSTIRERALARAWERMAGGNPKRLSDALARALTDAVEAMGRCDTVTELAPWAEAALMDGEPPATPSDTAEWRRTPSSVRHWVVTAPPAALLTYHVGQLAVDRQTNPVLSATADFLAALDHLGAVRLVITRTSVVSCSVYCASRRDGFTHHPLVRGTITPIEYRALVALRTRPPNVSVVKHLERHVPCSAEIGGRLVRAIVEAGFVRRTSGGGRGVVGIEITDAGREVIEARP